MSIRFALLLSFLLLGQAAAQSGLGFDPGQETLIDAQRVERLEGGRVLIGDGGVTIRQPGVILKAERMDITLVPETNEIERLIATGKVRYANLSGDAIAGREAVYVAGENSLVVTGDVVILQDGQVATGGRLVYDTVSGAMNLSAGPGGRVRGLFSDGSGS